ncbi:MAG: hypothetical protein JXR41_03790 [Bacteroidales bacterium]|nr:hypothetical protein [Bacteroidales bacterium]MBN2762189.1 hypothetical protein [Bacteroidales bacterium]
MKKTISHIIIKVTIFFMVGLMGMLIANKAIFTHSHQLKDGTIVNHAHPYNRSDDNQPFKSHHHTQYEFVFLNNIQIFFLVAVLITGIPVITKKTLYSAGRISACLLIRIDSFKGRSPPYYQ